MSASFASQEWADSLAMHLTDDARVRTDSVTWVFGPLMLVIDADTEHCFEATALHIDLHEGSVGGVRLAVPADAARVPFAFGGSLARWRSVFAGDLSLVDGVTQAKLRVRGDLPTLERHRDLLGAIAAAGGQIETLWQDEVEPATA